MSLAKKKIAIVGMAFRFPGGIDSSDAFWQALQDGKDLVTEVSPDRWDTGLFQHPDSDSPGKSYVFKAGQIDNVADFDAQFFGISPREAEQMDPQQRLLLELSWSALQDGGQRVESLRQSKTAVFMGVASNDYANRRLEDLSSVDTYTMTGNTGSIASNRISYFFDFQGPSVSVDTACSSSLVAVHEACKSLWLGEASTALAGGVNMLLHPSPFVGFSKASMLSPTGRCKPFASNGDGYVRSEGAAVLFLKLLDEAIRDGDRIHAVISNSAINSDGKTSGISMPSAEGQAKLLDSLYSNSDFDINELDYVEAHGTGTAVGDPIEASSLGQQLGVRRSHNHVLPIGSIKGNFGHLETASGVAGLVKVIHSLKNHEVPPTVNTDGANPNIDFAQLNLQVLLEPLSLGDQDRPLRMGVNSFGFGGANAHVVVEEYKAEDYRKNACQIPSLSEAQSVPPLYLTAASTEALKALSNEYVEKLHNKPADCYNIAWRSLNRQARLTEGVIFRQGSVDDMVEALRLFAGGELPEKTYTGRKLPAAPVVFAFGGNGSQWQGMGKELIESDSEFEHYVDQVDKLFSASLSFSVKAELLREDGQSNIRLTEYAQPMLFAIQVAMTQWLEKRGLNADYFLGHSVGEIAAAWAAGALTLEDAVSVVCVRSASQALTRGTGRMAAVGVSCERAMGLLEDLELESDVEIACDNAASSVTLSGSLVKLSVVENYCRENAIRYKLLDLDYAFHSRYMEPIEAAIRADLRHLKPVRSRSFIPTTICAKGEDVLLDAEYWWKNIREPVLFRDAVDSVIAKNANLFVEIGPHPVVRASIQEQLRVSRVAGSVFPAMTRQEPQQEWLEGLLYKTFLAGHDNSWAHLFPVKGEWVDVPAYPWQRKHFWRKSTGDGYGLVDRKPVHPLLGWRIQPNLPIWESHLSEQTPAYLADHVVGSSTVLPGSAYVELACALLEDWRGVKGAEIRDMSIVTPLVLENQADKVLRCTLSEDRGVFTISSRRRLSEDSWTLHCRGKVCEALSFEDNAGLNVNLDPANSVQMAGEKNSAKREQLDVGRFYTELAQQGLEYGDSFRVVMGAERLNEQSIKARLRLPGANLAESHSLHPAVLDGCFQLAALLVPEEFKNLAYLPSQIDSLKLTASGISEFTARINRVSVNRRQMSVEVKLYDNEDKLILSTGECRFKPMRFVMSQEAPKHLLWRAEVNSRPQESALEFYSDLGTCVRDITNTLSNSNLFTVNERLQLEKYRDEFEPLLEALLGVFTCNLLREISVDGVTISLVDLTASGKASSLEKIYLPGCCALPKIESLSLLPRTLESLSLPIKSTPRWRMYGAWLSNTLATPMSTCLFQLF